MIQGYRIEGLIHLTQTLMLLFLLSKIKHQMWMESLATIVSYSIKKNILLG